MPQPKLSAKLNNCPLHAITPELKTEILKFGKNESYDNGHNGAYEDLKRAFSTYYGFSSKAFTWAKFANILNRYNAFDTQIMMGPVLRLCMKNAMSKDGFVPTLAEIEGKSTEGYIDEITEIDPNTGRYDSLSPDQVSQYVGKDLGLTLRYYSGGKSNLLEAERPVYTVEMYHQGGIEGAQAGGHWERSGKPDDIVDDEKASQFSMIADVFTQGSSELSKCGLQLIKKHLELTSSNSGSEKIFEELDQKAKKLSRDLISTGVAPDDKEFYKTLANHSLQEQEIKNAKQSIDRVITLIKSVAVEFDNQTTVEGVGTKRTVLLCQVDAILENNQQALAQAYQTLGLNQSSSGIDDAIRLKNENISQKADKISLLIDMKFDEYLNDFERKAKEMNDKAESDFNYVKAGGEANKFCLALERARQRFLDNQDDTTFQYAKNQLKNDCDGAVRDARGTLDAHREWKGAILKFCIDALSFITRGLTDSKLGVFAKTASSTMLDTFEQDVNKKLQQ